MERFLQNLGKNSEPLTWPVEEERETARTMVSRLHVELGHSDPRGMIFLKDTVVQCQ